MKSTIGQTWGLIATVLPQLLFLPGVYAACAPGGSFDLSRWNLQLPSGSPGSPDIISSSSLKGCDGYSNSKYFFLDNDGSLVMKVPSASSGCVTTPNSKHCRTELREANPRSWDPASGVNRLSATLTVVSTGGSTVIGQIKIDDDISKKPVAELYYGSGGTIKMGVSQTQEGNQILTTIGNVPVGTKFSYEIRYESGSLSVILNGNQKSLSTYKLNNPKSYFKAGNYVQGSGASEVRFHSIKVSHGSGGSPNPPSEGGDNTCTAQPDNDSDNTVTLNLFGQNNCCGTPVQKTKIGNLGVCHNSKAAFTSINMKVGQNLFGKNNHVLLYSGRDCTGTVTEQNLTNAAKCWQGANWQSFMVAGPSQAKRWVA